MSNENYRLYSFTANLYLSPLQLGLQTAHAVAQMSTGLIDDVYLTWADEDKTIIICGAGNHAGVLGAYNTLIGNDNRGINFSDELGLPVEIFFEDEQSMNNMATACAVIVPECLYGARPVYDNGVFKVFSGYTYQANNESPVQFYEVGSIQEQFITWLKSYKLA